MSKLPRILSNMTLKKQLRLYLELRGITASQLAKKSSVPKQSISDWIAGSNPRDVRQVKRVADLLETSVDNLMFGEGVDLRTQKAFELDALLGEDWIGGTFEVRFRRVKSR